MIDEWDAVDQCEDGVEYICKHCRDTGYIKVGIISVPCDKCKKKQIEK